MTLARTVRAGLARARHAAGSSDPETGWLGKLVGTATIVVLLALHGPAPPHEWLGYGLAALAWAGTTCSRTRSAP